MKTNSIIWFEIYVDNMDRAVQILRTSTRIKLESLPSPTGDTMQMKTFPGDMEQYGANGALVKMDGFKAGASSTIVYFNSKDCTTEENRVKKAGGTVFKPKMAIGEYGFISLFSDTEGNIIGVHSME